MAVAGPMIFDIWSWWRKEMQFSNTQFMVTPEELLRKSTEVSEKIKVMERYFDELKMLVDKTKGYWIADRGDGSRKQYYDTLNAIDTIIKRLKEHPVDLVTIAQQYTDVEMKIQNDIAELSGDVIL